MATPSLTSAGLWAEEEIFAAGGSTINIKRRGVWTKVTPSPLVEGYIKFHFTGEIIFLKDTAIEVGSSINFYGNKPVYVIRPS